MAGQKLYKADLRGTNFSNADLSNANLFGAFAKDASFRRAARRGRPRVPPPPPPQQHSSPAVQGSVALALLADPAIAGSAQATATHAGCLQVAGLSTRQPEHHCSGLSPFELMAF